MNRPLLTPWDELLVHQAAAPVVEAGTSDHRFFDRIVMLGHEPNGDLGVLMGLAVYKNLNVMEGFACVRQGSSQHNLRLSRSLRPPGPALEIGPLRVDVEIPMRRIRATLSADDRWPHSFELLFDSRLPVEAEEHHLHVVDGRRAEDYIRFHQMGTLDGRLVVGGTEVAVDSWFSLRDHSWGVRPGVGGFEPRTRAGSVSRVSPIFGWFAFVCPDVAGQFELRADEDGTQSHLIGHIIDRMTGIRSDVASLDHDVELEPGTGRFAKLKLAVRDHADRQWEIVALPSGRSWVFRGTGYDRGYTDGRGLGRWRGEDVIEVDEYDVSHVDDVVITDGAEPVRTWHREQPVSVVVNGSRGEGHTLWIVPT